MIDTWALALNMIGESTLYSNPLVLLAQNTKCAYYGIGLILVIQTFYPSTLSVLYNKDVYPTSSIV